MKKYSKKSLEKRKEERKDFTEFFQKHIKIIKDNHLVCDECGDKLRGDVSEIAHILNKSFFKSVSTNDKNILYLCGLYSNNNCHSKFDNYSNEDVRKMKIFPFVQKAFTILQEEITEKLNYKHYEKYE